MRSWWNRQLVVAAVASYQDYNAAAAAAVVIYLVIVPAAVAIVTIRETVKAEVAAGPEATIALVLLTQACEHTKLKSTVNFLIYVLVTINL